MWITLIENDMEKEMNIFLDYMYQVIIFYCDHNCFSCKIANIDNMSWFKLIIDNYCGGNEITFITDYVIYYNRPIKKIDYMLNIYGENIKKYFVDKPVGKFDLLDLKKLLKYCIANQNLDLFKFLSVEFLNIISEIDICNVNSTLRNYFNDFVSHSQYDTKLINNLIKYCTNGLWEGNDYFGIIDNQKRLIMINQMLYDSHCGVESIHNLINKLLELGQNDCVNTMKIILDLYPFVNKEKSINKYFRSTLNVGLIELFIEYRADYEKYGLDILESAKRRRCQDTVNYLENLLEKIDE